MSLSQPAPEVSASPKTALHRELRLALIVVAVLVFGLGGLAATLPMGGAVVAHGEVSVESKVKAVQHPTGGVVAEILVKNGDHVREGQPLLRLDTSVSGPSATLATASVDQLLAKKARLEAEREDRTPIRFPPELTSRRSEPTVAAIINDETKVFQLRAASLAGQVAQLNERIGQHEQQIHNYQIQADATRQQSQLLSPELAANRELWEKRIIPIQTLNALEREAVDLDAKAASLDASIAETKGAITEIRQQMISAQEQHRSEASTELADVLQRLSELQRNNIVAADSYERSIIRAPQAGVVDKLMINTVGGVVPPGQVIMEIVPTADRLVVEARIKPADIDQVRPDQPVKLRFSAFDLQTTPQLHGKVERVSPEHGVDEHTGAAYYTVVILIPEAELKRLGSLTLVPGMPVEAFISTGYRTMLNYVTKPLADQIARSFREG